MLREEILPYRGLSPTNALAEFHKWAYKTRASPRNLLHTTKKWLQLERLTVTEGTKQLLMDKFLRSLPLEGTQGSWYVVVWHLHGDS